MRLFGWFRRNRDKVGTPPDTDDRLEALERAVKAIRLEWEDTYESLHKVARKLAKREQRALQGDEAQTPPDITPVAGNGDMTRDQLRAAARARGLIR